MPKKLFFKLNEDKRSRVINAGLTEFSEYGFNDSSTNRIVKIAEISKGSLFKYFSNKEDLYFYILDCVITKLTDELKEEIYDLPQDIFERVIKYSELEFDWYIKNPDEYKLLKGAFAQKNSDIYEKTLERYQIQGNSFYYSLFQNADFEQFKCNADKVLSIIKWFLNGFNEEYISELNTNENLEKIKNQYVSSLKEYIVLLKEGIIKV